MLRLNINYLMNLRGIKNSYSFLKKHGFSNHKIRLFHHKANRSVNLDDLEYFCTIFNCTPNDLFDWSPDKSRDIPSDHLLRTLAKDTTLDITELTKNMNPDELKALFNRVKEFKEERKSVNNDQ